MKQIFRIQIIYLGSKSSRFISRFRWSLFRRTLYLK